MNFKTKKVWGKTDMRNSVDVITTAFNEEDCIDELVMRVLGIFDDDESIEWRLIAVDNGSTDATLAKLLAWEERDSRVQVVKLSRNFRMDGGLTAGLEFAVADAVIFMASDLQDPPEVIPQFVTEWRAGYDSIFAIVTERTGVPALRRLNSRLFYRIARTLTNGMMPENVSDFRLMDRQVYETVRRLRESNRFLRGLVAWVGFSTKGIEIVRPERFGGRSKAYSIPVVGLALGALFAHSNAPLHIMFWAGASVSLFSLLGLVAMLIGWIAFGVPFAGFGAIVALIVTGFAITAAALGLIAEYVGLIYNEVKSRPNFVVERVWPVEPKTSSDSNAEGDQP